MVDGTVVSEVIPDSPSWRAGVRPGDRILHVNGVVPRDIIEWNRLMSDSCIRMTIDRGGEMLELSVDHFGESLGMSVTSALFDRVQTCDNHCEFCFIYQLPKGMRRSLYLKDDDYRLSFLFGNFTTLTRFTEADLERVIEEKLSPLYVSIHATDPEKRSEMLRNPRGGVSLRWVEVLLAHGIDVRAQIVLCPGVNDRDVLESTLAGMLERFPGLESIAIVPLGLSRFNSESRMRIHTPEEARDTISMVTRWQERFQSVLGRQPIHLADEFYMVAGCPFPEAGDYDNYPMLEDGIGIARAFIEEFNLRVVDRPDAHEGFFAAFDSPNPTPYVSGSNPAAETGLRSGGVAVSIRTGTTRNLFAPTILTGEYGAAIIGPLVREMGYPDVEVRTVRNDFFGGNTAVAGLMTFEDVSRAISEGPTDRLFLLPDVCLNDGVFLDGRSVHELSSIATVEVLETNGRVLREFLDRVCGDSRRGETGHG